jgi:hypothetical protein
MNQRFQLLKKPGGCIKKGRFIQSLLVLTHSLMKNYFLLNALTNRYIVNPINSIPTKNKPIGIKIPPKWVQTTFCPKCTLRLQTLI